MRHVLHKLGDGGSPSRKSYEAKTAYALLADRKLNPVHDRKLVLQDRNHVSGRKFSVYRAASSKARRPEERVHCRPANWKAVLLADHGRHKPCVDPLRLGLIWMLGSLHESLGSLGAFITEKHRGLKGIS